MSNSLNYIGNPTPNKKFRSEKITAFGKETRSKFNLPLSNSSNTREGIKPCARDGHSAIAYEGIMIIFGGDRHNMSFNNLFLYDLKHGLKKN